MINRLRTLRTSAIAAAAITLLPVGVIAQTTAEEPLQAATNQKSPPLSVIQKLRAFLGVNPPVAVGGSRSRGGQSICLLSPLPSTEIASDEVPVDVVVSQPFLIATGQLNEVRIEKQNKLLWKERGDSVRAIEGVIPWPIQPLKPGEEVTLKIRPRGASGGDFATFLLKAGKKEVLEANDHLIEQLGNDPVRWNQRLEKLGPNEASLAAALWSNPKAPDAWPKDINCGKR